MDHNIGGGAGRDGEHADPNGHPPSLVQYCTSDAKSTPAGVVHHGRATLGIPQIASFGRREILVRQPRPPYFAADPPTDTQRTLTDQKETVPLSRARAVDPRLAVSEPFDRGLR